MKSFIKLVAIVMLGIGSFSLTQADGGGGMFYSCFVGGCYTSSCTIEGGIVVCGVVVETGYTTSCTSDFFACCNITGMCYPNILYCDPLPN